MLAMRLLVAYSRALTAFPATCDLEVEARADGVLRLALPRGGDRCVLCLPDRIAPTVADCRDATAHVGAARHGLTPLYLEVKGPQPSVSLTVEAAETGTDHRSHLLFRNRELARVHGLTMHLREPMEEAVYLAPGQTVTLSVELGDSLADNRRLDLFALTDVMGEPCSLPLEPEPDGAGFGTQLEAQVFGWHPVDLVLVDRWTEVTRRERRLHLNVMPPWTVGLNGYTVWLRQVRRPGKDPRAQADFADLRWAVRHARDLGFQVVLLLPVTDPVGRSPYEQLSTMALDPDYLVLEDFLQDASRCLDRVDLAYEAFASQDWVCEYTQAKARRIVRYGYPDLLPGGRFHDIWIRFLESEAGPLESPFSFEPYRRMGRRALQATAVHRALVRFLAVQQYFAHEQLKAVVAEAHALGMRLLFDQPLYPSSYSAERTFHPERFQRARWMVSPDGSQRWRFARYDWDCERGRGYADYIRPLTYFVEQVGFDGFRWDAIHTVYLDGQEELLKTVAERFAGKPVLRLGEQLGADERLVNPALQGYGYTLYLVPWWYPGHGFSDTVEKLEERLMLADRDQWWLASSLHDHPRISEWFKPLVERYGRLPGGYDARMVGQVLAVFAFFPNFVLFCGDEYASTRRINVPGDAANTWDGPPPWAEGEAQGDLADLVRRLNCIRFEHVALRCPGGRRVLLSDAKARGLLSLALTSDRESFILLASFSPKYLCGWVEVPFTEMGIDPQVSLSLTDLLTGESLEFVPGESLLVDEQAMWVHLRFGEPRLLHVPR